MANETPVKDTTAKTDPAKKQNCPDDFKTRPDLDGKNDSGPDPEVHGKELPPQ
jgi:hypothetical protein